MTDFLSLSSPLVMESSTMVGRCTCVDADMAAATASIDSAGVDGVGDWAVKDTPPAMEVGCSPLLVMDPDLTTCAGLAVMVMGGASTSSVVTLHWRECAPALWRRVVPSGSCTMKLFFSSMSS